MYKIQLKNNLGRDGKNATFTKGKVIGLDQRNKMKFVHELLGHGKKFIYWF